MATFREHRRIQWILPGLVLQIEVPLQTDAIVLKHTGHEGPRRQHGVVQPLLGEVNVRSVRLTHRFPGVERVALCLNQVSEGLSGYSELRILPHRRITRLDLFPVAIRNAGTTYRRSGR